MLPLEGITVIAVEQAVAAPFCSSRLADAGAHVIKVERPEGDFARGYDAAAKGQSSYFVWLNRGKESVVLDLAEEEDRAELTGLITKADILVQNLKPGALARVAALFSRRGFNIESLAVGATEQKDMSRMTIVVSAEETPLEQVTKQLNKLVNVIKIIEQNDDNAVSRELALIKVRADAGSRSQVIEAVNLFRAKVIDVSPESLTIEATGDRGKIEALLRVLEPFGIREIVQSGVVSLSRGPRGIGGAK